jgi:ABC-type sugar transport system ATPase subunit
MIIQLGEVHAILGENGAGKSTLVKILSGVVSPNAGSVILDGMDVDSCSILEARRNGIATAFQELGLIPNMTVAENLFLPQVSSGRFWPDSKASIIRRAKLVLARWEVDDISPHAIVEDLTLAQRQRIELTRALSNARRLLILDEPTAALPDTSWLFRQIRRITACGVSVLYISHRLSEVREICQRATVLRNGTSIETVDLAGVNDDGIFSMMVGHFVTEVFNPEFLPELSLNSALEGMPTPGATIQALPKDVIEQAPNEPGINCRRCEAPKNLYEITTVKPTVLP